MSEEKLKKIMQVPGIKTAVPMLINRLSTDRMIIVGLPQVVLGIPPDKVDFIASGAPLFSGKRKEPAPGEALVGFDISSEMGKKTGDTIVLEDKPFVIVGVFQKTTGLLDGQIIIPLKSAQVVYDREGLITNIIVEPEEGVKVDKLASDIEKEVDGIRVIPPSVFQKKIRASLALWDGLSMGAALTACFAGALCVVIIMLVSVSERVIEIGIKKAIGATTERIMLEFITESVLLACLGWASGVFFTVVFINLIGKLLLSSGANLFELTTRLLVLSLAGALLVGTASGFYPAFRASTVSPVEALKIRY